MSIYQMVLTLTLVSIGLGTDAWGQILAGITSRVQRTRQVCQAKKVVSTSCQDCSSCDDGKDESCGRCGGNAGIRSLLGGRKRACGGRCGSTCGGHRRMKFERNHMASCGSSCSDCADSGCLEVGLWTSRVPPKRAGGGPFRKYGPCWYTAPTEWSLFGFIPLSKDACSCESSGCNSGCHALVGGELYDLPPIQKYPEVASPSAPEETVDVPVGVSVMREPQRVSYKKTKDKLEKVLPAKETPKQDQHLPITRAVYVEEKTEHKTSESDEARRQKKVTSDVIIRLQDLVDDAREAEENSTLYAAPEPPPVTVNQPMPPVTTTYSQPPRRLAAGRSTFKRPSFGNASIRVVD